MEIDEAKETMTQRMIETVSIAVIANNRITNLITLELCSTAGSFNLNIAQAHWNIFATMKVINTTFKNITFRKKSMYTLSHYTSTANDYTPMFDDIFKCLK